MHITIKKYNRAVLSQTEWNIVADAIIIKCNIKRGNIKKRYPDECSWLDDDKIEDIFSTKDKDYEQLLKLRDKLIEIYNSCY